MTYGTKTSMHTMSRHASAGFADAASSCAHCACMHTTSNSISVILDAILMASIIIIGLVNLNTLGGIVLPVLVLLAGLLVCRIPQGLQTRTYA
ncbi:hypothetical protein [uncultured Oscillibacter sp.]|uniref:hypothetical protein n=1 Tax=uncultured Oscillibacter sp. TaxID=876091 RepID=UPI0025F88BEE|nr:hypothetical protein [uncultured Oscillibacter sp.]